MQRTLCPIYGDPVVSEGFTDMTVSDSTVLAEMGGDWGVWGGRPGFPVTVQAELLKLPSACPVKVYRFTSR